MQRQRQRRNMVPELRQRALQAFAFGCRESSHSNSRAPLAEGFARILIKPQERQAPRSPCTSASRSAPSASAVRLSSRSNASQAAPLGVGVGPAVNLAPLARRIGPRDQEALDHSVIGRAAPGLQHQLRQRAGLDAADDRQPRVGDGHGAAPDAVEGVAAAAPGLQVEGAGRRAFPRAPGSGTARAFRRAPTARRPGSRPGSRPTSHRSGR